MEYGSIEREIYVDASPEIVFDVVSRPEHVQRWWPDEADYPLVPGAAGRISFGEKSETFTVVDVRPHRSFAFRWTHPEGEAAAQGNSFLVVFDLTPQGDGTLLRMSETGFRERGWSEAVAEEAWRDHVSGWDFFLPRLAPYAGTLRAEVNTRP
ncbi:SRPBCC domain-containing protein [Actinoplanes xinjiangensis]|uniref:SRPBCC domain-containing protein n=1 Tax=Actinoplanes xinjiangensis TaxID=512350 RepID=UPI00342AF06F